MIERLFTNTYLNAHYHHFYSLGSNYDIQNRSYFIFYEVINDKLSIKFTRLLLIFAYLYCYVYRMELDMRKSLNSLLVLWLFAPWVVNAAQNDSQKYPVESGEKEVLVQSDHSWNGTLYKSYPQGTPQLTVIKLHIEKGHALPWHKHVAPNTGYVAQGQLTLEDQKTGEKKVYKQGQAFAESVDQYHRGIATDPKQDTVLVLTYAGTSATPLSVPAPGEKNEY